MADIDKVLTGVGSIASPVAAIGGSVINGFFQSRENRKNREWTEHQNDLAWQRQNQLINEQRAYDSPKAQMQRLMEAGLNPNLIYDDLGGNMQAQSAPNAAGSYQGTAPQVDPLALSQSLLNMANARKADQDTKMSKAETDKILKLTDKEYELLDTNVKRLNQAIDSDSFNAALSRIKVDWLTSSEPDKWSYTDDKGEKHNFFIDVSESFRYLWNQELKSSITQNDANAVVRKFYANLKQDEESANKIQLENQQLNEFVKVASDIAKGQASEARLLQVVSDMDSKFYEQIGAGNGAVSNITKLILALIPLIRK